MLVIVHVLHVVLHGMLVECLRSGLPIYLLAPDLYGFLGHNSSPWVKGTRIVPLCHDVQNSRAWKLACSSSGQFASDFLIFVAFRLL